MKKFLYNLGVVSFPLIVLWVISVPVMNYILDPYGLLSEPHHNYKTEPNMRSLKREYVNSVEKNYPLLLFSNSRGGVYDIQDERFYNMSYSMGLPEEFLEDVKFIIKQSKIDSLILFIDETCIYEDYKFHFNQPLRKVYSLDDFKSILTIPFSYQKVRDYIIEKEKSIQFFLDEDGRYEYYGFEHISNRIDTLELETKLNSKGNVDNAIEAWLKFTDFLLSHDIGFSLYIHPISKVIVEDKPYIVNDLRQLVSSLQKSGLTFENTIVIIDSDSTCFYDDSHYTPQLANYVLKSKSY